jgi:membrane protein YqaA with SNARE-associated domain
MSKQKNIKQRSFLRKVELSHSYYKRSGLYKFLGVNLIKLILILGGIVLLILLLDQVVDFRQQQDNLQHFVERHNPFFVFSFFLLTESFMGFIPPDIFMVWGKARFPEHAFLIVGLLGTLSYIGGINAYFIGVWLRKFPKVEKYIQRRYEKNFELIEKWGGVVIIMAALFPLPFAMISTIAGIVRYPFRTFALYGLTRYIRFFLYAIVIFGAIKNFM